MLTLVTGEPGGSKTLNTIKMINEGEEFKGREIYYRGIKSLQLPWIEIDDDGCRDWAQLPKGSVIVIDEAQEVFKKRSNNKDVPDYIMGLATHRHSGFDIFLITQQPTLIDHDARKFVNRHFHYERPFNTTVPRRLQFQKCANDPTDYHARQEALVDKVKLDKKYFDLYKSAEIHTHKAKLPKKVYFIGLMMVLVIAGGFHLASRLASRHNEVQQPVESLSQTAISTFDAKPKLSYAEMWKPRLEGLPHTAPAYDKLNEPTQRPMPNCIVRVKTGDCNCFTQQATAMDVPFDICHSIVKNGFFDPAKPLHKQKGERAERELVSAATPRPARSLPSEPQIHFIPSTGYPFGVRGSE